MNITQETPPTISEPKQRGRFADFFIRLWREKPLGTFGGMIVLLLIFVAIFADALMPYPYDEIHLIDRLQGSSSRYLLGTDQAGRDLLSRLIYGARLSLAVGLAATTLNVVVALLVGGTSGFLGGKVDMAAQRFVDVWMAFSGTATLADHHVHRGAGFAPDHPGLGDNRSPGKQKAPPGLRFIRWLAEILHIFI